MEKPIFIQCGDEKINAAFIIRCKAGNEYGHQIIFNLADGQTVNFTYTDKKERDKEFAKI